MSEINGTNLTGATTLAVLNIFLQLKKTKYINKAPDQLQRIPQQCDLMRTHMAEVKPHLLVVLSCLARYLAVSDDKMPMTFSSSSQ
eukprot:773188-Pelagomonas_calceolata.AAC.4